MQMIPDSVGKTWRQIFDQLLENELIGVALYRRSESRLCYVVTNPSQTIMIEESDRVMVIDKQRIVPEYEKKHRHRSYTMAYLETEIKKKNRKNHKVSSTLKLNEMELTTIADISHDLDTLKVE
eukprot:TRINITY_DN4157_c0_g2_i1.p1 TRINITY_DN4157_c0_g2~~TRINITY_DN4157_c0_g2_i1.p1  ORF type:complete len:124 (-),score=24.32 TRINITY_DN4157_c0_g2_i1:4-375(-)